MHIDGDLKATSTKLWSYASEGPVVLNQAGENVDSDANIGSISDLLISSLISEAPLPIQKACIGHMAEGPCLDLKEAPNKHNAMWLNSDGTAHVEDQFGNQHTCQCSGQCDGVVGTWDCLDFYDGRIVITDGYGDDFTAATGGDSVGLVFEAHFFPYLPFNEFQSIQCVPIPLQL